MINPRAALFGIIVFHLFINLTYASIDLVAEIDYYPKNASVGDNVTVIQTIKNLGSADVIVHVGRNFYPGIGVATPYTIPANSEINVTSHITLHYGKIIISVKVDTGNIINESNETNNNATLTFYFPVFVKTDKKEYRMGEQVSGSIIGYNGSGYTFVKSLLSFPFKVFKFENGSWKEVVVEYCKSNPIVCYNNKITIILGECVARLSCKKISVNSSWTWNQKHWIYEENVPCGNETYNRWVYVPTEPGQYKFGLYYGAGGGFGVGGCKLYIESKPFTILQNCSSDLDCASGEKCINETCRPINYCENDFQCNYNQICINHTCVNLSCEFWQIAINHTCVTAIGYCKDDSECPPGYYCSNHRCYTSRPYSPPRYNGRSTVVVDPVPPTPVQPLPLKEFSIEIPEEIVGLTITFNLGRDAKGAEVTAIIGNKTSKSTADANGTVNINLPEYGQGKIIISKKGYKNLTKNINVYAGKLNITKIFGEKYGDKFKFKVTDEKGNAVKDAEVEVYGEKLKTDIKGIVEKEIKIIQKGLIASATKENYKNSSLTFDVNIIGTLKIIAPKSVNEGEKVIVKVTDENNNPVANASVDFAGKEYITNEKGEIEIIATQTLSLKASKEGYSTSDEVSVIAKPPRAVCGNGKCEIGETKENCPQDCIICGDGYCDKGENYTSCPNDCQKPEEFSWLIIIGAVIMLAVFTYFLIFRKK